MMLLGALVVLAAIALIVSSGGAGDGDGSGPKIVNNWSLEGLPESIMETEEPTLTNLEGQTTTFIPPLEPPPGEVWFVYEIRVHVTWSDEGSPPTQVTPPGYDTNDPDHFQVRIRLEDSDIIYESVLTPNPAGQAGDLPFSLNLLGNETGPKAIANPVDAKYLPAGYFEHYRIDIMVYTEECGDWPSQFGVFPPIPDAGNSFDCTWSVHYYVDSTMDKP